MCEKDLQGGFVECLHVTGECRVEDRGLVSPLAAARCSPVSTAPGRAGSAHSLRGLPEPPKGNFSCTV